MSGHVVSLKIYLVIFFTLLALTATTVGVAFVDMGGHLNTVVAISIAVFKAMLVVLYFMHLRYSGHLLKLVAASGLLWLTILLSLTMSDYLTRDWIVQPTGWTQIAPAPLTEGQH
jgi:cytochrome c oxidase subunit 4